MKRFLTPALALITLALMATEALAQTQRRLTCLPGPSGMVAWWPLDGLDPSTGEYVDLAGGDNGTPIGNPSQIPGLYIGNSLQAGTGKYVNVADAPNLNFGQKSFTIDAWVKFTPGTQTEPIVFKLASASGNGGGYFLYITNASLQGAQKNLRLQIANQSYSGPIITATQGTWIFVAATVNKTSPSTGKVDLYVGIPNAPLVNKNSPADAFNASSPNTLLQIGRWTGNPHASLGIDEVEIFNRALSPQEIQNIYAAGTAGKCKQEDKGMTWIHQSSNAQNGTITVGCSGCDPYKGDTVCSQPLPVLCIHKPTPAFPLPVGLSTGPYNQWSGGVVATTPPIAGNTFADTAAVNAYCQAQFNQGQLGPAWRVAEFHDGWGWNFQAYGGTVSAPTVPSTRFWVYINDQLDGNCWKP